MKRWIIFLGRGGTILVSVGLALLLVSFIPSAQLGTQGGKTAIPPKWNGLYANAQTLYV